MTFITTCQVCGEALGDRREEHACETCETRHHQDCWEYNGGCSVYACAGGKGNWRAITLSPLVGPSIAAAGKTPGDVARLPQRSYRDRPVMQMDPPPRMLDRVLNAGHVVIGVAAMGTFFVAVALGGTEESPVADPYGETVGWSLLLVCLAWGGWAFLHWIASLSFPPTEPITYYPVTLKSGDPREIVPASQIESIQVVEKTSPLGLAEENLYGVALHLVHGDRVLIRPFDYGLEEARRAALAFADALQSKSL